MSECSHDCSNCSANCSERKQESFLKAYTRFDTFRGASSEKTWLTRIVINTCKDIRRTAWFRHRSLEISAELPGAVLPPDETHIDLMDAILKLPLQSREVILLKYDQGLNNEEIAGSGKVHINE